VTIEIFPDEQVVTDPVALIITPENWNETHFVRVNAVDDDAVESPPGGVHSGRIRHSVTSEDPYYDGIAMRDVIVAIFDNDYPGVIVEPTILPLIDGQETLTYTVQLTSRPTDTVAIGIDTGPELRTAPLALLFTPEGWSSPQTVLVIVDDGEFQSTEIRHSAGSNDMLYDGIEVSKVIVTRNAINAGPHLPIIRRGGP
jgi:hypothetical protein